MNSLSTGIDIFQTSNLTLLRPHPFLKVHSIIAIMAKILCYHYPTHYNNNRLRIIKTAI